MTTALSYSIPWYILLKYRAVARDACSALTKFMRDDLNASKDPINAGCVGCLALKEFITRAGCRADAFRARRLVQVGLVTFSKLRLPEMWMRPSVAGAERPQQELAIGYTATPKTFSCV